MGAQTEPCIGITGLGIGRDNKSKEVIAGMQQYIDKDLFIAFIPISVLVKVYPCVEESTADRGVHYRHSWIPFFESPWEDNAIFIGKVIQVIAISIDRRQSIGFGIDEGAHPQSTDKVPCTIDGQCGGISIGSITEIVIRSGSQDVNHIVFHFSVRGISKTWKRRDGANPETGIRSINNRVIGDSEVESIATYNGEGTDDMLACIEEVAISVEVYPSVDPAVGLISENSDLRILTLDDGGVKDHAVFIRLIVEVIAGSRNIGLTVGFKVFDSSHPQVRDDNIMPCPVAGQERGIAVRSIAVVKQIRINVGQRKSHVDKKVRTHRKISPWTGHAIDNHSAFSRAKE